MIQYSHGAVVDCGVDGAVLTQDAADQLCVVFIAVRVDVEGFDNCLVHSVVFPLRVTDETEEGDGGEFRAAVSEVEDVDGGGHFPAPPFLALSYSRRLPSSFSTAYAALSLRICSATTLFTASDSPTYLSGCHFAAIDL